MNPRRSTGTREAGRPYHHGSLPDALVAHAVELLDEAGPDAVVVREVARRAGVSPGAPFRHFPDRAALLAAVAEAVAVDFAVIEMAAVDAADAADTIPFRALGAAFVGYARTYPHRFALLRAALFGAERTPALEAGHRAFIDAVVELIEAGQRRGELRQADPEVMRIAAQALSYGLSQMIVDGYLDGSQADETVDKVIDLFGRGVLAPEHPGRDAAG